MVDEYSIDITESQLQSTRDDLNKKGLRESSRAIPLPLAPGEYRITPRFSDQAIGPQLKNQQGEKIWTVAVRTR